MAIAVVLLITLATMAYLAYPILRPRADYDLAEDDAMHELAAQRDATYAAIKELEFDSQSGSLSKEDGTTLEQKYKQKAVSILKEMDAYKTDATLDDAIEKQVQQLRQKRGGAAADAIEHKVAKLRPSGTASAPFFCSQCGARQRASDRFCSQCGAALHRRSK